MAIGVILIQALLLSAQPSSTLCSTGEHAASELRAAHEAARRAHLLGNVDVMAPTMADEMVSVSNGDIKVSSKAEALSFFRTYFGRVRYLEWSDVAPPTIHLSPDGKMGWMAVKIQARYVERDKPESSEKSFKSSWIATYQRVGCDWKMTGNASAVVAE